LPAAEAITNTVLLILSVLQNHMFLKKILKSLWSSLFRCVKNLFA